MSRIIIKASRGLPDPRGSHLPGPARFEDILGIAQRPRSTRSKTLNQTPRLKALALTPTTTSRVRGPSNTSPCVRVLAVISTIPLLGALPQEARKSLFPNTTTGKTPDPSQRPKRRSERTKGMEAGKIRSQAPNRNSHRHFATNRKDRSNMTEHIIPAVRLRIREKTNTQHLTQLRK